jgi:hypothetical protein
MMLVACNDSGAVNITTKPVDKSGGTVSGSDGTAVAIPMGALGSTTTISISSVTVPAPAGTVIVGPAYDFGPAGTTFAQPVTITLPFDMSKIPTGHTAADVRIYTAPKGSTNYTQLTTTLMSGFVQTTSTHFTVFVPAAPAATTTTTDMAGGGGVADMATGSCAPCTPTVLSTSPSCSCTGTCGGKTYLVQCSGETTTGPFSCFCEINGATQSSPIPQITMCSPSIIMSAYQQCLPN